MATNRSMIELLERQHSLIEDMLVIRPLLVLWQDKLDELVAMQKHIKAHITEQKRQKGKDFGGDKYSNYNKTTKDITRIFP